MSADDFFEPAFVVFLRPAVGDRAAHHRAYRPLDPQAGVDVDDDGGDDQKRAEGVQQRGEADHVDREVEREIRAPDHDARGQQAQHAQDQHEEQQLLPAVVAADFGQLVFAVLTTSPICLSHCTSPLSIMLWCQKRSTSTANEANITRPINGWRMRVHCPPPRNMAIHAIAGWNIASPDTASSTKQMAVIQWLLRSLGV